MINTDNIDVKLPWVHTNNKEARVARQYLKNIETWLKNNNIKYSIVYFPVWAHFPTAINMRKEDALVFKLVYDL